MTKIFIAFILLTGNLCVSQKLALNDTKWKSNSFWGYGNAVGSELFSENTKDSYNTFEFVIEFDEKRFVSTNLTSDQGAAKQIKGKYHLFSNNYIKLKIDSVFCRKSNETCSLPYKSDYTQIHKYSYNNDGKIEFLNTQYRDSWIDKIVNGYLEKATEDEIKNAFVANYYIEWLPIETKKIKGDNYTVINVVRELNGTEKDFDLNAYTKKYKILSVIYIQLPSQKIYKINQKGKLEEWKP